MQRVPPEICYLIKRKYVPGYLSIQKENSNRRCLVTFRNERRAKEMKNCMYDICMYINKHPKYIKPVQPLVVEPCYSEKIYTLCKTSGMDVILYGDTAKDYVEFHTSRIEKIGLYQNEDIQIINEARIFLDEIYNT